MIDSHTGLRPELSCDNKAKSGRDLLRDHARAIVEDGGMIGLGTSYQKGEPCPMNNWLNQYKEITKVSDGKPVALGTDMNGLDLHMDKSEVALNYPFDVPCSDIDGRDQQVINDQMVIWPNQTIFRFKDKGLAHYGMLPEFFRAVGDLDQNGSNIHNLFSSADAFVKTWECVEQAQRRM